MQNRFAAGSGADTVFFLDPDPAHKSSRRFCCQSTGLWSTHMPRTSSFETPSGNAICSRPAPEFCTSKAAKCRAPPSDSYHDCSPKFRTQTGGGFFPPSAERIKAGSAESIASPSGSKRNVARTVEYSSGGIGSGGMDFSRRLSMRSPLSPEERTINVPRWLSASGSEARQTACGSAKGVSRVPRISKRGQRLRKR